MNEILQFIIWWVIAGFSGFCMGSAIDYTFYKRQKIKWKMIPLSLLIGPITILISFRSLLEHYLDERKKKSKNKNLKDLKECFIFLNDILSEKDKEEAKKDPEFGIKVHHSLGRTLRNNWYLWRGGKLKDYFKKLGIWHADDMSGIILTSYHRYLNGEDLKLDEQIKYYQEYWKEQNAKGK